MADVDRHIHADEFAPEVVARSKHIVATAAEELKDYERWIKDFVASEEESRKRHARSLKREQARHRRQLKRERRARAGKRAALGVARAVRSASRSTAGAMSRRKGVRVTSQWPALHGAARRAEPLPHRRTRGFLWLFLDKRQASRCDAGDAEDSRDRMVLAFRQNAGARSCISESGWCWCDLGFCQGT